MTAMVGGTGTTTPGTLLEMYDTGDGAGGGPDGSIDKAEYLVALSDYLFGTGDDALDKAEYLEILESLSLRQLRVIRLPGYEAV